MNGPPMRALRLHGVGGPVSVDEIVAPVPAPGEAVLRVDAAGMCGSDWHIVAGQIPLESYPRVLGHEIAGTVVGVSGSERFSAGDRVVANFLLTCGTCRFCVSGRSSLCTERRGIGLVRDGGLAELVSVPVGNLIPIPDAVDSTHAALATDAYATPFHAIVARARVRPGEGCAVIGAGGLGLAAIQLLALSGASPIVAVDVNPVALDTALACGATHALTPADVGSEFAGALTHVFDFVGSPRSVHSGCELLHRGGGVVVVGHSDESWQTEAGSVMVRDEKSVSGSYAFDDAEIASVLDLMASGSIDPSRMIGAVVGLDEAATLLGGGHRPADSPGRTVVIPTR